MKKYIILAGLLLGVVMICAYTVSPSQPAPIEQVVSALKTGNASQLSKYFDNTIEISLPDKSDSYSRSQAEIVLKDFFDTKGVKGFEAEHKGNNNGSQYCIGTLVTRSGNYRTTVYMKQKTDRQLLQEVRIETKR